MAELTRRDRDIMLRSAEKNILLTMFIGTMIGVGGMFGYSLSLWTHGLRLMFVSGLLASAAFVCGFFIGTLFGMPKRTKDEKGDYTLNNSLVEISDWLTKIIVGLSLVNIVKIPGELKLLGEFVATSAGSKGESMDIYVMCLVVYFGVFSLYLGYNYMRLVLSQKYKDADEGLMQKLKDSEQEKEDALKKAEAMKQKAETEASRLQTVIRYVNQTDIVPEEVKSGLSSSGEENDTTDALIARLTDKAELKYQKGKLQNPNDPQNKQWGEKSVNNRRQISASVTEVGKRLYNIQIKVSSTDPKNNPLAENEIVMLALHDTFGDPPLRVVPVKDGTADLQLLSYGSFTIGAFVDKGETELELNLAELPGVSEEFKNN